MNGSSRTTTRPSMSLTLRGYIFGLPASMCAMMESRNDGKASSKGRGLCEARNVGAFHVAIKAGVKTAPPLYVHGAFHR